MTIHSLMDALAEDSHPPAFTKDAVIEVTANLWSQWMSLSFTCRIRQCPTDKKCTYW